MPADPIPVRTESPIAPADVELLLLDVDGVLTDGSVIVNDPGEHTLRFNTRDGFGIALWHQAGLRVGVITGRKTDALKHRLEGNGIDLVIQGARDKAEGLRQMVELSGESPDRMAFLGDDWIDGPVMRRVGYPMAVADAEPDIRRISTFITARPGGRGAVRDAVEHLLIARGVLDEARARYDLS
ncbi:MAG: HAD hydrolase family protein [Planctomycetota bacterium]